MRKAVDHRGFTLIEVLIAAAILAVGLLALLSAFPIGYINVNVSGGQSKATAYAQQRLESIRNQPFTPGPFDNSATPEVLEAGQYTRSWTIQEVVAIPANPVGNRLARIQVTVVWTQGDRPTTVTLETMRAE